MRTPTTVKIRLLDAAVGVIRAKGYSAATVDDIPQRAGVTKGGFFHHFDSKEDLAVSAAGHFSSNAEGLFSTAPYRNLPDPLDRLLGYVDYRKAILQGELPEYTCLLGTMVQEAYDTHPGIREACDRGISCNAAMLELDIAEAVIQKAFIQAKTKHGPEVAAACLDHLRLYLVMLFIQPERKAAA
jgi:TetR/AcrR family transcriptional repressor of nem operon